MFNEVVPIVKLKSALICVNLRFYGYLLIVVSGF